MSEHNRLRLAFGGFAILIAARDIYAESPLRENGATFAFWIAVVICLLAGTIHLRSGLTQGSLAKLQSRTVVLKAITLSALTSVIYLVTFLVIERIGAGDFNLIDYGLSSLLTAAIGFLFFKGERLRASTVLAFILYGVGLWTISTHQNPNVSLYFVLALASPISTAASDGITKWLLTTGGLTRAELLLVRFLPSVPILFVFAVFIDGGVTLRSWWWSLLVAASCGFFPLWLLCTGLGKAALNRFAIWEFLIPVVAFIGTLQWHPEHRQFGPMTGASLIVAALLISELGIPSLKGRSK